jgi:magnesium-protoporphyrin O-methyltransferase
MGTATYRETRGRLEVYFDRTAAETWARLTSTAPVGRIRATVRAGRDAMRSTLLSYLPEDLGRSRILDAGCGTGALSREAAGRGAAVLAIDLSPTLIRLGVERSATLERPGRIEFRVADMLDSALGEFDHVVAMDSLIHYRMDDVVDALAALTARTARSVLFTFAPKTPLLMAMWMIGRLLPRSERAPAIEPIDERALRRRIAKDRRLAGWFVGRTHRIDCGFYRCQAMELVRR